MPALTACKDCEHIITAFDEDMYGRIEAVHYCRATPGQESFKYYDGIQMRRQYAYCRDVNTGHCAQFQRRDA